jgi:hypothetical protein
MPSPTFYVSLLNPEAQALAQAGLFTGAVTAEETGISLLEINIPLADIKSHFKFKCVGTTADDGTVSNIDITGVVGVADETAAMWTFPSSSTASAIVLQSEFLGLLAKKVFGSASAVDLFSNRTAVEAAWHVAAGTHALASLKTKTYDNGITASKELIDAMFYSSNAKAIRFSMAYDATADAVLTTTSAIDANSPVTGASGSGAFVEVTATGISVKTTGSGYVAGGSVTIGGTLTFKINSVQAAMLNGTLGDAAGTEVPLCVGDKIKVVFEIDSKVGQLDVNGDPVSVAQRFNVEYTLVAA